MKSLPGNPSLLIKALSICSRRSFIILTCNTLRNKIRISFKACNFDIERIRSVVYSTSLFWEGVARCTAWQHMQNSVYVMPRQTQIVYRQLQKRQIQNFRTIIYMNQRGLGLRVLRSGETGRVTKETCLGATLIAERDWFLNNFVIVSNASTNPSLVKYILLSFYHHVYHAHDQTKTNRHFLMSL